MYVVLFLSRLTTERAVTKAEAQVPQPAKRANRNALAMLENLR